MHSKITPLRAISLLVTALLIGLLSTVLYAQEIPEPDPAAAAKDLGIYVTTQDFSSFRAGPGLAFKRLLVIPPATTAQAIGRSADTRWLQIEYEGQYGWIASWLLIWNGDVSKLPIDGINPARFARKIGVLAVTTRETPLYRTGVDASDQIGTLPAGTQVEVTARLGAARFMQFQITYEGQVYWVGSWNLRIRDSNWRRLFDTSYLNPYGRLVGLINSEVSQGFTRLSNIENIWDTLGRGQPVSCNYIPKQLVVDRVTDADLRREPVFVPVANALQTAVDQVNAAIIAFEDACARPPEDFFISTEEIDRAKANIDDARRNFNLAKSLIQSLAKLDPLVNPDAKVGSSF